MLKQPLCTYCGMEGHLAAACTWKTSLIQCDDGIHLIDLRKGFSDFYGRVLRRHPDGLLVSVRKATAAEIVIASLRAAAISSRERTADAAPADVPRVSIDVAVNRFEGPAMHWAPDQSERSLGMVEPKQAESSQGERIIQTAPERIYLIVGTECPRDVDFSELTEVSWCENDIDDGIEYVRADKAGAALARVAELEQERDAANSRLHEVATACATAEQQRDAALAKLAELETQVPVAAVSEETFSANGTSDIITRNLPIGTMLYAAPVAQAGQVPEGYALIPTRLLLDKELIECIAFHCGDGGGSYGDYQDGILFIGEITDDDGRQVHGLHLACAECEEEGYTTLVEFAAAPAQGGE